MNSRKTIKSIALGVMLSLSTSVITFAGEGNSPSSKLSIVPYLNTDYSIISYNNTDNSKAFLVIKDESGNILLKENVTKGGFSQKVLDFTNIEDGAYNASLQVEGKEVHTTSFNIKNHKLYSEKELNNEKESKSFANVVKNTLYVSHLALDSKDFAVTIADNYGVKVYESNKIEDPIYSQKFDLSSLPKGKYTLNINSANSDFSYDFIK